MTNDIETEKQDDAVAAALACRRRLDELNREHLRLLRAVVAVVVDRDALLEALRAVVYSVDNLYTEYKVSGPGYEVHVAEERLLHETQEAKKVIEKCRSLE